MITIDMGWPGPPLRSNGRHHWAKKAGITKTIRTTAKLRGTSYRMRNWTQRWPMSGPVVVSLIWTVCDKRRRDAGASSPTLKGCLDGLVDAGILSADDHTVVREERCRIEVGETPSVRIEIEVVCDG